MIDEIFSYETELLKHIAPGFVEINTSGIFFAEDPLAPTADNINSSRAPSLPAKKQSTNYHSRVEGVSAHGATDHTSSVRRSYMLDLSSEAALALTRKEENQLPAGLTQKELQKTVDEAEYEGLMTSLAPGQQAWLRSGSTKGAGAWRGDVALQRMRHLYLGKRHYYWNWRLLLFLPTTNLATLDSFYCPCDKKGSCLRVGWDDYHALECSLSSDRIIKRHNDIRDLLIEYLNVIMGQSGSATMVGAESGIFRNDSLLANADCALVVRDGAKVYLIDVTVTNPSGNVNLAKNKSASTQGGAAAAAEKRKLAWWTKNVGHQHQGLQYVPFVLETGGLMGQLAKDFINDVS
jgi:hypothetical protein